MDRYAKLIKATVATMSPVPIVYVNTSAGVVFNVERQSGWPRVLRLVRRDLDDVMTALHGMESGSEGFDCYDSFSITYGIPIPILSAHFGHRIRRTEDDLVDVTPSPRRRSGLGVVRTAVLQLRTGVMTVSADDRRTLAGQLGGAVPRRLDEDALDD